MKQEVFFENIQHAIIKQIDLAQKSLFIAVAWFTDSEILDAVLVKAKQKIKVNIVIFFGKKIDLSFFEELSLLSNVNIYLSKKLMHNKFCIIDEKNIINGSYNWTYNSKTNNENITVTTNNAILAKQFIDEFEKIKRNTFTIQSKLDYKIQDINLIKKDFKKFYTQNRLLYNITSFPIGFYLKEDYPSKVNKVEHILNKFNIFKDETESKYFFLQVFCNMKNIPFQKVFQYLSNEQVTLNPPSVSFSEMLNIKFDETATKSFNLKNDFFAIYAKNLLYEVDVKLVKFKFRRIKIKKRFSDILFLGTFNNYGYESSVRLIDITNFEESINRQFSGDYSENPNFILMGNTLYDYNLREIVRFTSCGFWVDISGVEMDKMNNQIILHEYPFAKFENNKLEFVHGWGTPKIFHYNVDKNKSNTLYSGRKFTFDINEDIFYRSSTWGRYYIYDILYYVLSKKIIVNRNVLINIIKEYEELLKWYDNPRLEIERFFERLYSFHGSYSHITRELEYLKNEQLKRDEKKIIKNNKNCYIATLSYGDIEHENVKTLREFRDNILINNSLGCYIIRIYYKYSPVFVAKLEKRRVFNKLIRLLLDFIVFMIKLK